MPRKPKRPCSHPGCPALVEGRYCDTHQKLADQQYEKYQRDPQTKKRYGRAWQKIRDSYITAHPLCAVCQQSGHLTPAQEVHHIVPLPRGGTHDPNNLMSLCTPCHSRITAKEGGRWDRRAAPEGAFTSLKQSLPGTAVGSRAKSRNFKRGIANPWEGGSIDGKGRHEPWWRSIGRRQEKDATS